MLLNFGMFVLGLVLLIKGSDYFVKYAASIAKKLGTSELIIGLTIVSIGTSLPELVSSIIASINHAPGLVIGNVVGSNIANIGLVVGIAATLKLIVTKQDILIRDADIMMFVSVLFFIFAFNGTIGIIESIILLAIYFTYLVFLIETEKSDKSYKFRGFIRYFFNFGYVITIKSKILQNHKVTPSEKKEVKSLFKLGVLKDLFLMGLSSIALYFGGKYLIAQAIIIGGFLNIPNNLIGISLIAIGTSLPELVVTLTASSKGYGNIAIGNILGSNIANICLVLGVSGLINPLKIISSTLVQEIPFMLIMSLLIVFFIKSKWQVRRLEGVMFLVLYFIFMILLFISHYT